ncbi:MAG TPA: flippase [Verrucomicrobiae bacterium]|jgi:O-antigen/teichoic acid export membrane protein|nr:flippase [Verrucomicrobiae bacterium]
MSDLAVKVSPGSESTQKFRSQVGHISRQSGVFFAGAVFTAALGYVFKVYLARVLGAEDLGIFALGATLVGFLGIFNTLGLPQSAVRFVASYQAAGRMKELHALIWRGGTLLLVANVIFACVLLVLGRFVAVSFYHAPKLVKYLPFFAVILLFNVLNAFYGKVLAGYHDLQLRTLIVNFIGSPLQMILAVLFISFVGLGLRGYLLAQIVTALLVLVLLMMAVRRFTPQAARFSELPASNPPREIWSFSASILTLSIAEFGMAHADRVALGFYRSAREVGIYSVASAMVVYVPVVLSSINQIFAPMIADLHTRGEHVLLARLFQSLTKWVIALTFPLALVIIIFARPFMRIFGPGFESGWPILVIGTIGQLVNCGVGSVGYLLLMSGNERRLMKVQFVMAAVMVAFSIALVPLWGIIGAAVASATTNIGVNAWNLFEVRGSLGILPYNRGYLRLLLPSAVILFVELLVKRYMNLFHHDWIAVACALVSGYLIFAAIILLSGLDSDDRLIASAIWSRIRGGFAWIRPEAAA